MRISVTIPVMTGVIWLAMAGPALADQQGLSRAMLGMDQTFAGHATVQKTVKADLLQLQFTMSVNATNINDAVEQMQALRAALEERAAAAPVKVEKTTISSVNIRQRGAPNNYTGQMQLSLEVSGHGDPLTAISQLADDTVTQAGNLRYGFSEKLVDGLDLCGEALAEARGNAGKLAANAGQKLGAALHEDCQDIARHRLGQFTARDTAVFSATARVSYARAE